MKYKRLFIRLHDETLHMDLQRFHYEEQPGILYSVYEDMKKKSRPCIYYHYDYYGKDDSLFIFTLGKELDDLQKKYIKEQELSKAYALNCLSLEFLTEGYAQIGEIIKRERRQFLQEMIFSDTEEVEQTFPHILPQVPKQTVIFHALTGSECTNKALHDCANCHLTHCIYRKKEF